MIWNIAFIGLLCIRSFLATVLIMAGSSKLADRTGFVTTLIALGIPTYRKTLAHYVALIISLMELLIGLAVIVGIWQTLSDLFLLGTMAAFSFISFFGLYKAPQVECRCFGALNEAKFNKWKLTQNTLLAIAALIIFLLRSRFPLQQAQTPVSMYFLLFIGYLLLAFGAAQSAKIAILTKERVSR